MLISFIKGLRHKAYIALFRMLPIENNKIICWSNNLKAYGCNPKYITEYLCKNYPYKYDIVWAFNEETPVPDDLPEGVRAVKYFSIDYLRELHTAKVVITNARIGKVHMFHKRKGQFYIQTWHGSLGLKKIEAAATLPESYVKDAKNDSENIDLIPSGCDEGTRVFTEDFWYNGEILKSGTPRCDVFFGDNSEIDLKVRAAFNIPDDKKIALFAPTFRNNYEQNEMGLDYAELKNALERRFGGEYYVLYRFHPNVRCSNTDDGNPDWLINATKYNDMQELLAAADVLVTDYSSSMFDFSVAGKNCFLFIPDVEEYVSNERGLCFDIRELPYESATTNEALSKIIINFDQEKYNQNIAKFLRKIGSYEDGKACRRIAGIIEKKCF